MEGPSCAQVPKVRYGATHANLAANAGSRAWLWEADGSELEREFELTPKS